MKQGFCCQGNSATSWGRGLKMEIESHEPQGRDDEMAAGAICPQPNCGALTSAFHSADRIGQDEAEPWGFTCSRCGIEFTVLGSDLVLQSVGYRWPFGEISRRTEHSLHPLA